MKYLLLAAALVGSPVAAQRPQQIMMDSVFLRYLEQIAETAHVEQARCIVGYVARDTTWFLAIAETPWIVVGQTDRSVSWVWRSCPGNTVALWHAHIWRFAVGLDPAGAQYCWISEPDTQILANPEAPPFALVSVRRGQTCLFVRMPEGIGQVRIRP